jgi:hypothetical protein
MRQTGSRPGTTTECGMHARAPQYTRPPLLPQFDPPRLPSSIPCRTLSGVVSMRLSIIGLLILILAGCRTSEKPPAANFERLADAYVAVLRLKAQLGADTTLTSARFDERSVDSLKARGFTKEEFQKQIEGLSDSPERIRLFSERVQALMSAR